MYNGDEMQVTVWQRSTQMSLAYVKKKGQQRKSWYQWCMHIIFKLDDKELWEQTRGVAHDGSWLLMGDFNYIRYDHEKRGGDKPHSEAIDEFNGCIQDKKLEDLKWWGQKFTWWNKQEDGGSIDCKLDHVLVHGEWKEKFPWSDATFLLSGISDHSSCVVNTGVRKDSYPKPFRFFDM